jgi:hypothetical protein
VKQPGLFVSVKNKSNIIYGHSAIDFNFLRQGSMIKIAGDYNFYTISNVEKSHLSKQFRRLDGSNIELDGNYSDALIPTDEIKIYVKEYEVLNFNIINYGLGYQVGDLLYVEGGIKSINDFDNTSQETIFKVDSVGAKGSIHSLSIVNGGLYVHPPESKVYGGSGSGLELSINYISNTQKILERSVSQVSVQNNKTVILLDIPIPDYVISGSLSVEKNKLILTAPFLGETNNQCQYEIIRDYTPNFKFPLILKNSANFEEIYNETIKRIDIELANMKSQLASK